MSDNSGEFEKVSSDNEEVDDSQMSENEGSDVESIAESIKEGMPESLDTIFAQKSTELDFVDQKKINAASYFTKTRHDQTASLNVIDAKKRKAEEIFQSLSLFASGKVAANAKSIKPINSVELDKKERQKQREENAGKAWGYMPKVEMTEELKMDLKAIQMRNQIFPKRFYRGNDSQKLPEYFQIGTVVDDGSVGSRVNRLTKKQQKKSIAQQFLMDDQAAGFSKRKYETLNDKRRRMGDKKKQLRRNKTAAKHAHKMSKKVISKKK